VVIGFVEHPTEVNSYDEDCGADHHADEHGGSRRGQRDPREVLLVLERSLDIA
jgi:hypothetical protein